MHLQDSVTLKTAFLRLDALYSALARADLAVLPYKASDEGSSGTAAECLASGLPLLISDANIFEDIRDLAVTTVPQPDGIARAINRVLSDPQLYRSLASRAFAFARENRWDRVAGAFLVGEAEAAMTPRNLDRNSVADVTPAQQENMAHGITTAS